MANAVSQHNHMQYIWISSRKENMAKSEGAE